ncbi:MAG: N-acetyltransferase family protein [Acidobacteriota bacterium]
MSSYLVRPATERDGKAVRDLARRGRRETLAGVRPAEPGESGEDGSTVWVVEAGRGEIVGCCAIRPASAAEWEVATLYLTPEWRGFGLGRALLEQAVRAVRQQGALALLLPVSAEAEVAVGLARQLGFVAGPPAGGGLVLRFGAAS